METIRTFLHDMFLTTFKKEWYETYWIFDLHGTIIKPTYKSTQILFYPFAKETLQFLTETRPDIKKILWTSSFPEEIKEYNKKFKRNKIKFEFINCNPDIDHIKGNFGYYKEKFYFDVMFDNKAGFNPEKDWELVYWFFKDCYENDFLPDPNWTTKY
jgi:hypothetical protein